MKTDLMIFPKKQFQKKVEKIIAIKTGPNGIPRSTELKQKFGEQNFAVFSTNITAEIKIHPNRV